MCRWLSIECNLTCNSKRWTASSYKSWNVIRLIRRNRMILLFCLSDLCCLVPNKNSTRARDNILCDSERIIRDYFILLFRGWAKVEGIEHHRQWNSVEIWFGVCEKIQVNKMHRMRTKVIANNLTIQFSIRRYHTTEIGFFYWKCCAVRVCVLREVKTKLEKKDFVTKKKTEILVKDVWKFLFISISSGFKTSIADCSGDIANINFDFR